MHFKRVILFFEPNSLYRWKPAAKSLAQNGLQRGREKQRERERERERLYERERLHGARTVLAQRPRPTTPNIERIKGTAAVGIYEITSLHELSALPQVVVARGVPGSQRMRVRTLLYAPYGGCYG